MEDYEVAVELRHESFIRFGKEPLEDFGILVFFASLW